MDARPVEATAEEHPLLAWWSAERGLDCTGLFLGALGLALSVIYPTNLLPTPLIFLVLPLLFMPAVQSRLQSALCLLAWSGGLLSLLWLRDPNPESMGLAIAFLVTVLAIHAEIVRAVSRTARSARKQLETNATIDGLSGALNRKTFEAIARREVLRASRYRDPLTLLMVDVDDLKLINDESGHPAGDAAIRAVSTVLISNVRDSDVVGRIGGDEFAILLAQATTREARTISDRISRSLETLSTPGRPIRASTGYAQLAPDERSFDHLYEAADRALYAVKERRHSAAIA